MRLKNLRTKEIAISALCIAAISMIALIFSFAAKSQIFTPSNSLTDSSVFQYVARVMLKGGVPYRDTFDHKGPLIYFINAFALWLSPEKGLWIVELVVLVLSFVIMYRLSRLFCNKITSVFVVIAIVPILYQYFEGGNFTEEYALPLVAGALYIFSDFFINKKISRFRLLICGASLGAVLMLRVNMISVWIVMSLGVFALSIYNREYKRLFSFLGYFMLGLLIVVAPFIIWLAVHGALKDFWNSYIVFNFAYSSDAVRANIYSKAYSFLHFLYVPLVMVAGGVTCVSFFKKRNFLDVLYLICLILTLLLTCISGQFYGHYGMIIVPILIIPLAYIGKVCDNAFEKNQLLSIFIIIYLLVSSALPTWQALTNNALVSFQNRGNEKIDSTVLAVSSWVEENTGEDERIIVCGNWNIIYNQSNRFAASKYSYQSPICEINSDMGSEFFEEISQNKPKAIILLKGFFAYDKMQQFIIKYNYVRVNVNDTGDNIELYIAT